jgi:cell division transport system permease protein
MSITYTLKESFSGFTRTKLSTTVSIVTICISLLLLGVFAVITINTSRVLDALRSQVEMEVFLQEPLSRAEVENLIATVSRMPGVSDVEHVSKEEAARVFKEQFGEDIQSVLDFNPLPQSLKISLQESYRTASRAEEVYQRLSSTKGVESVIYRKALLEFLDQKTTLAHNITLGLGVLISLSAIFLVSNTIRLAIYAKRRLLRTMELVGATAGFIRTPFLLEGILQGLVGGVFAAGMLYALFEYAIKFFLMEIAQFVHMPPTFYVAVVGSGIALGLIGSIISVSRFITTASYR